LPSPVKISSRPVFLEVFGFFVGSFETIIIDSQLVVTPAQAGMRRLCALRLLMILSFLRPMQPYRSFILRLLRLSPADPKPVPGYNGLKPGLADIPDAPRRSMNQRRKDRHQKGVQVSPQTRWSGDSNPIISPSARRMIRLRPLPSVGPWWIS
jgi:hypothetical protein